MEKDVIKAMTLKDKIAFCSGADFWRTKEMKKYSIPSVMMADGPHGLRKQEKTTDMLGVNRSIPATSFPTSAITSCSWDEELLYEIGKAIASEARANGVSMLLGPGANIKRSPLCGRNFEYFSEDPLLTGKLAAAYIKGAESTGVSSCLKHFACNSQEYKRFSSDSVLDERTLREIYLTGFEIAVKEGRPSTVMCSYNKINGEYASDSKKLLTDILRSEWGFDGMVVTDWGALSNRTKAFIAGCDLNMPGGSCYLEKEALQDVKTGVLPEERIDASVKRVLSVVQKGERLQKNKYTCDYNAHYQLSLRAALESAVLLKNENSLLPLSEDSDAVFIGAMAKHLRYQGAGSSHINPYRLTTPCEACPDIPFIEGCLADGSATDEMLQEAKNAARTHKYPIVFVGLPDAYESEGFDRRDMRIPVGHVRLLEAVAEENPNTIAVLFCGSAVELPWAEQISAILFMGLPGEAGGEAVRDLVFGKVSPSGKLSESWPIQYSDTALHSYYGFDRRDAHYREGVYVGYRYFATANIPVRFPFGYGLSYSSFEYSDICLSGNTVSVSVKNTGKIPAKETVQLYIQPPKDGIYRPKIELRGFQKLSLMPGEEKKAEFVLTDRMFGVWDGKWVIPGGEYTLFIGKSSTDLPLCVSVHKAASHKPHAPSPKWYMNPVGSPSHADFEELIGRKVVITQPEKGKFTMSNTIMDMKDSSLVMRFLYSSIEWILSLGFGGKKKAVNDPTFYMLRASALDASLSGMRINAGLRIKILEGLLKLVNFTPVKNIKKLFKTQK
ncbi:MAG: glycoside hydrolase family 3 protein [Clostridia bacterium]|nr:glycoside hydrolase family 3 protein [Clostridia bacterium]